MLELLLGGAFAPFAFALALLAGLLVLEIAALLMGGSLTGGSGDAGLDAGGADPGEFSLDAEAAGALGDAEAPDPGASGPDADPAAPGGLAGWLGLGRMPALIWLAALLLGFGLGGIGLQMALTAVLGLALPAWAAAVPAAAFGLWFARGFGGVFARLLPQTETAALPQASLGRRRGVITQGTAARGRPAEVRVTDRFGNAHYLRAEPLEAGAALAQGTEVLVMRDRRSGSYVLIPLSE